LIHSDDPKVVLMTLTGTVRNGEVEVIAVSHSTDDEQRKLKGRLGRIRWREERRTREAIVLTELGKPWGLTVGLTRDLP